ncbi:MAG: carbohydrate porin [Desulfovibrionaceae bacterium]
MLVLCVCLGTMVPPPASADSKDEEISRLKQELQSLKQQYLQAMQSMEKRLQALEDQTDSPPDSGAVAGARTAPPAAASPDETRQALQTAQEAKRLAQESRDLAETSRRITVQTNATAAAANKTAADADLLAKGFEFHGYFRAGYGANSRGGSMEAFKAPGADAKYRLGNEAEAYGELCFVKNFLPQEEDGPWWKVQVRPSIWNPENKGDDPTNTKFSLREAFAQAGNFSFAPQLSFWAGERFYRRQDIHIIDFYYDDMSGFGGGVEDIPLGDWGKMAVAYFGGSSDTYEFENTGKVSKSSLDLRVYDLDNYIGTGTFWVAPSGVTGGTYKNSTGGRQEYRGSLGLALGYFLERDDFFGLDDGYTKFSAQYGRGSGSDFSPVVQDPNMHLPWTWQLRLTTSGVWQANEHFSMMPVLVYQLKDDGSGSNSRTRWISGGARPIISFTEHVALAFEAGADWVKNEPLDASGVLYKFTIAPELRFAPLFFARPVLRAYATYATWGEGFRGLVGGTAFDGTTAGANFGVQMEAWW